MSKTVTKGDGIGIIASLTFAFGAWFSMRHWEITGDKIIAETLV